jgi:hypothetical protein
LNFHLTPTIAKIEEQFVAASFSIEANHLDPPVKNQTIKKQKQTGRSCVLHQLLNYWFWK